jgi:predicted phage terminase large subunit-like protein
MAVGAMAKTLTRKPGLPLADMAALRQEKAKRCKASFAYFLRQAWPTIEPSRPLIEGIHVDACCQHLQAIADGLIHRLVVNIAPGHGKSSIFSVAYPAWVWTRNPYERFLCASYALDLSIRDNRFCRLLIESEWYQSLFGDVFTLSQDQNLKSYFENDKRGYRQATAVRASGTGKRATTLIIDDPNNGMAGQVETEAARQWFGRTWIPRLNNQEAGNMITVGQRLREKDVTGHILELGGWEHVNLPEEYAPSRKCVTSIWEDPRTEEGQLLCPKLLNEADIAKLKKTLGPVDYSAQYDQEPIPPGGYVFEEQYERLFSIDHQSNLYLLETPDGIRPIVMSSCKLYITSDVAAKAKEENDFTVFSVWAVTPAREVLLLHVFRAHLRIPKQVENGYTLYLAYVDDRFQAFYFEDVAYQGAFGQYMLERGVPCMEYHPKGDKTVRAGGAAIWMKLGNVYFLKNASWLEDWRSEMYKFPKAEHDDQVDNLSMICIIVKQSHDMEALDKETADALSSFRGY